MQTKGKILIIVMVSCICVMPAIVAATSFFPEELTGAGEGTQTVMKVGTNVYIFHSGTSDVKHAVGVNDILTVYREEPCRTVNEVGKIKILSFNGANYIRAEVVEGEIRQGDTAKKDRISFLIIPAAFICK
jgi:hypothetical protein